MTELAVAYVASFGRPADPAWYDVTKYLSFPNV